MGWGLHLNGTFFLGLIGWGSLGSSGLWGLSTLSTRTSLGLGSRLVLSGPYLDSRNPQYLSSFAILAAWALLSASGAEYEAYAKGVPRFIDFSRGNASA